LVKSALRQLIDIRIFLAKIKPNVAISNPNLGKP